MNNNIEIGDTITFKDGCNKENYFVIVREIYTNSVGEKFVNGDYTLFGVRNISCHDILGYIKTIPLKNCRLIEKYK